MKSLSQEEKEKFVKIWKSNARINYSNRKDIKFVCIACCKNMKTTEYLWMLDNGLCRKCYRDRQNNPAPRPRDDG